jgi:hypothetical protein
MSELIVVGNRGLADPSGSQLPSSKLTAFKELAANQPRDTNGFLTYFIDHRHIPADILQRPKLQQDAFINASSIPLSMLEGYLSHSGITPVWDPLEHEPPSTYNAFKLYLNRPGCSLADVQEQLPQFDNRTIEEAYYFFYWKERSKACQLLRPVAAARLRDQRVIATEDAQYQLATHVLSQLAGEISERAKPGEDGQPGRPFQGMSSANLITALTQMIDVQRNALRIPKTIKVPEETSFTPKELASPEHLIAEAARQHDGKAPDKTAAEYFAEEVKQLIAGSEDDAMKVQEVVMGALVAARTKKEGGGTDNGSTSGQ